MILTPKKWFVLLSLSNQMNLQLCFINDSGSEEEDEDTSKKVSVKVSTHTQKVRLVIDRVLQLL